MTEIVKSGLAVGALGLTYQAELLPGKTLAFETAVDATMDRPELDGALDAWIGACRRQAAIEELPLVYQALHANRQRLKDEEKKRANAEAAAKAREGVRQMERPRGTQRPLRPQPVEDGNLATMLQQDQAIANIRSAIRAAEAKIPYLKALIDRQEPPEQFPLPEEGAAAAA